MERGREGGRNRRWGRGKVRTEGDGDNQRQRGERGGGEIKRNKSEKEG